MSSPVWLITGASGGFGLSLCLRVLRAGHHVVGTVRNKTKAASTVQKIEEAGGTIIEMDMTESKASISAKVKAVVQDMGRIDYLVNNAGYSLLAACEEISEQEASLQMATNFFGPLYTLQAALPAMRSQRSGTIINISSVAAQDPQPACSLYSASKAALEAASESLVREITPYNIRVLIVEPGNFRTNFINALAEASHKPASVGPPYTETVGAVISKFLGYHGKQIGDPEKGADRVFEAVTGGGMVGKLDVQRLVIGSDALARMQKSSSQFVHELSIQEESAKSTDFE